MSDTDKSYPPPGASPEAWIDWYRQKLDDMDRLLQAAYRESDRLRMEAAGALAANHGLGILVKRLEEAIVNCSGSCHGALAGTSGEQKPSSGDPSANNTAG